MTTYPVQRGFYITSPFGWRDGGFHTGTDFGHDGGSGGYPIYAIRSGTVIYAGAASGYGGPDPCGWLVIDHPAEVGGGTSEIGHLVREVSVGDYVQEGQRIGHINPDSNTNGGVAPHCHISFMPYSYDPSAKIDPMSVLDGAAWPGDAPAAPTPAPASSGNGTTFGIDISEHQDGISLAQAKRDGIEFVIIRLCDGTYRDRVFASHLADAEQNGLVVSTYWYVRHPAEGTSFAEQVDVIDAQLGGRRDLGVWLDIETETRLTGEHVRQAKAELERRGYRVPGVYSYVPYWESMPGGEPSMDGLGALWVAAYGSNRSGPPTAIYPGNGDGQWNYPLGNQLPALWQFGSNANVAGFLEVDVNAYRGSRDDLAALFTGRPSKEEDMTPEQDQMLREVHRELRQKYPSRSKYRATDAPIDTLAGYVLNLDARIHEQFVENMAKNLGKTPDQVAQALRDAVNGAK